MLVVNRKAALAVPVLFALLVNINSLFNRWALDDHALIANNPAAQSVEGALDAFFQPYWPPDQNGNSAGLYRPLTTLSYGLEWTLSGGRPAVFHASNVVMHALATALVVLLALAWLSPKGALVSGVLFAVHPVHVEAVANVIGRAEIMSTIGILVAVLAARRYRAHPPPGRAWPWVAVVALAVLFAQLSKENGVIAIAILLLDDLLDTRRSARATFKMYWLVAVVTFGWFYVWKSIAGGAVELTVAPGLRWLTSFERIATALPAQLDAVRLLVWPMSLAASYDPQLIPQRLEFGTLAAIGLLTICSIVGLGLASFRKAPAVAFGLLAGMISYAPTSNLVFSAGLMLGERTLYFSSIAPVLVMGWLVSVVTEKNRRALMAGVAVMVVAFSVRTFTRNPFWTDMRSVVTNDMLEHPEGFRTQYRIGEAFEAIGDSTKALNHFLTAVELFKADPFASKPIVDLSLAMGRNRLALSEAERAYLVAPFHLDIMAMYSRTLAATGDVDSALSIAQAGFENSPSAGAARLYLETLGGLQSPEWQIKLARARLAWLGGRPIEATLELTQVGDLTVEMSNNQYFCWELQQSRRVIPPADYSLFPLFEDIAGETGCSFE